MKTSTSKWLPDAATWARPRSQFVPPSLPPGSVRPAMRLLTTVAPAAVETDCRVSRLALLAPAAGAFEANVNSDIRDGGPVREFTNVVAGCLGFGRSPPTDVDRSTSRPTLAPHLAGMTGFVREFCQTPPEASLFVLPVAIMKLTVEE